ncbi:hypothetical protein H6P81_002372 [Aristolochia fimbriata]|uniref:INO80 complex subunit B-like conserved region domain-containing protein n=1 Tax=Aristolochia fimbriata TaxID=158543 RepID=A0AAV7FB87_ARIFI|nr:hypothetical protein H6P81_002372 [Aristolochia fimbriata]
MEAFGGSAFDSTVAVTKKKRSSASRRPRPDSHSLFEAREISPSSSTPPSDNASKASSDENAGQVTGSIRKELNLNDPRPSFSKTEGESLAKKSKNEDGTYGEFGGFYANGSSKGSSSDVRRSSEGVLAPANWKNSNKGNFDSQSRSSEGGNGRQSDARSSAAVTNGSGSKADPSSHENKLRKVKLKVGGVTRTIHAKSAMDGPSGGSTSKSSRGSDAPRRQKLILQENSDDELSPPERAGGLQGVPWKGFSSGNLTLKEGSKVKLLDEAGYGKHADKSSEPVRKSKRVPKRRVLDGALDEDEDDELRYLGRLKTAKASADRGAEYDEGDEDAKKRKSSKSSRSRMADGEYDDDEENGSSRRSKDSRRKLRSEKDSEDTDYVEDEEDLGSDGGPDSKRKKPRKESLDSLADGKKEISLTTRQRALQSGKDGSSGSPANLVEFPNGLPAAPPRKQKEKLSEVEQQLKKAEAAQRRRMQVEKANRESEAEAIRKIRGQDSNRKKKEDKQRKQRDELARERAANAAILASNAVRWVMGPNGTVVTFPKDLGLPSIFDSKPNSYPPPREKCAGPSCTNTYKYRDSKSKLPLCSLQCYRAVQQTTQPVTSC